MGFLGEQHNTQTHSRTTNGGKGKNQSKFVNYNYITLLYFFFLREGKAIVSLKNACMQQHRLEREATKFSKKHTHKNR